MKEDSKDITGETSFTRGLTSGISFLTVSPEVQWVFTDYKNTSL